MKTRTPKIRPDLLWKELLETFFYAALEVFHPELFAAADITKEPVFLSKELRIPGRRKGQKIVDLLADVPLAAGGKISLLLHTEVQGGHGEEPFNERMFKYACVIALRLERSFTALAIRTTPREKAEEITYSAESFGTQISYKYLTVFIDQLDEEQLLAMKHNPVALAVVSAKRMLSAGKDEVKRFEYAKALFRLMKGRGYTVEDRLRLALFVDGITNLRTTEMIKEIEQEFDEILKEAKTMSVLTPALSRAIKKKSYEWGLAEGEKKLKITVANMVKRGYSVEEIADIMELSVEEVEALR